jgi:hypothetical protein
LFSYITYGESEWGWSSSWYWDTKKTELMGYTDGLWGALFTRFSDKDIWEVGKKGAIAMAHMRHSFANA